MAVTMSEEMLQQLMGAISAQSNTWTGLVTGSFARCTARFNGTQIPEKVKEFTTTIVLYKDLDGTSDENALKGLPLLLQDTAATWWEEVKTGANTFDEAIHLIRTLFAPSKPPHSVYIEFFGTRREKKVSTDLFVCQKRALLAELPYDISTDIQLDMLYGLLHMRIRKRIPRTTVNTFDELLQRARDVEANLSEAEKGGSNPVERRKICSFCGHTGHTVTECRKRQGTKQSPKKEEPETRSEASISCYGCGKAGVIRSKCPVCSPPTTS
ncbi:activity-regulated cytoskeleton associated protein 2-like [Ctenocephalides felis]|uniref:activity-regulated cytoskeleton associated protein 2-like n=1 Tax=Ctenocephalides felis TaxID=7515 RepID=UPI000E6E141C|nr:activity-regulated cytoskeleton associated protein 2-like [Ctenocephalides felis]